MSKKMVPKLILEGARLTLKTDIAFALNEHPRVVGERKYRYHSPIVSAEWCAFTNHPWGRGLINFEPREAERAMATYEAWLRLFELLPFYSWIVDRFHLSTQAHQLDHNDLRYDFSVIEERLVALGFRLVLCTRSADSFAAARTERLKVSGNPGQYDDLDPFIREQDLLRNLAERSRLPTLELDVSSSDVAAAADAVAGWLEQEGGLWADDAIGDLWRK